jgi:uncharacterized membrane protein YqhA
MHSGLAGSREVMAMLGKLLRYETKAMARVVLPFYGALIGAAILLAISLAINGGNFQGTLNTILNVTMIVLVVGLFIASWVVCLVLIIQRYYKNLLGDEGYLMFTLPVKTGEHIACKTISSVVWTTAGIITGIVAGLIILLGAIGPVDFMYSLKGILSEITEMDAGNLILLFVEVLLLVLVGGAANVCEIFAAISIGHLWSQHRVLGAILAYIGISTALSMVTTAVGIVIPLTPLSQWMSDLLNTMVEVHIIFWFLILGNLVCLAIFSLISWTMLDKHLNLQ